MAANGLYATGTEQGDFDRLSDQGLDFLGRQTLAFGDDDDAWAIEVREDVDRQTCGQVRPVDHQHQADDDDHRTIAKCKSNQGVEHSGPS